jgi:hypothetical protein
MSSRWRLLASGNPSKTPRQFSSETYLSGGDGYEPSLDDQARILIDFLRRG